MLKGGETQMRNVIIWMAILLPMLASAADVITVRRKDHHGRFEKFENGQFVFHVTFGDILKLKSSSVTSLVPNSSLPVSVHFAGQPKAVDGKLIRFWRAMFEFEIGGAKKNVYPMKVKHIVVKKAKAAPLSTSGNPPGPRQFADISHLEHRTDLPPHQTAALKQYITARDNYKAFLTESSQLVRMMDAASGQKRLTLLEKLRSRKDAEQPVLRALDEAEEALFAAFPPPE